MLRTDLLRHGAALGVLAAAFGVAGDARGQVVTFDGLTPGSSQTTYTEGAYTVGSVSGSIFVGGSTGAVTTGPVVFPSSVGTRFQFSARPFDLRTIDLGPLNESVGPQTITFTGTRAAGGTVSQTFTTPGDYRLQTFTFDPTFSRLASLEWSPGLSITDNIDAFQGPTITFEGLTPGSSQTSYAEDDFRVTSTNGAIFVGGSSGAVTTGPVIFPSSVGTQFSMAVPDGSPFDVFSVGLAPLNDNVGPQTVTFTGTLLGGGTVSQSFTTPGEYRLQPFGFGPEFANLTALTWTPGLTVTDNIVAAIVPEPTGMALVFVAAVLGCRRRRRSGR